MTKIQKQIIKSLLAKLRLEVFSDALGHYKVITTPYWELIPIAKLLARWANYLFPDDWRCEYLPYHIAYCNLAEPVGRIPKRRSLLFCARPFLFN